MSIFTRIKDAIFGNKAAATPATPTAPRTSAPSPTTTATPAPAPKAAASAEPVDVAAVLQSMAAKQSQQLNWKTSIVDLMKLLGIDSSLQNRKDLAHELGYQGDMADSASMNIWLHKRVMQELAANGGKVPPELKD